MPMYFAYGSNMDVSAMASRCPRSKPLGPARLMRFRFAIMPEGYATVLVDPSRTVHGVLWDLALSDVRQLDAYEDFGRGLYRKVLQPVIRRAGGAVQALIYVASGAGGLPREGYLRQVISAAQSWQLPAAYIAEIATFDRGMRCTATAEPRRTEVVRVRPRFASPFDANRSD